MPTDHEDELAVDDWFDDGEWCQCPRCMGSGSVDCHCGGDQCYCENHGDAPCPVCGGDGEVTVEREQRYLKAEAKAHREMKAALTEALADKE